MDNVIKHAVEINGKEVVLTLAVKGDKILICDPDKVLLIVYGHYGNGCTVTDKNLTDLISTK